MANNWIYKVRSNTLQKRLFADLEKEVFTDVTIEVGSDGNKRTFKAHRLVLASENSELEKLLRGSYSGKIKVPDVHPKGFENLIRYCYGERILFKDESSIRYTYVAAEKFKARELKLIIENELNDLLKFESLIKILTLSIELKMAKLKEKCLAAISWRLQNVLATQDFISAPLEAIELIVYLCRDRVLPCRMLAQKRILVWAQRHKCSDLVTLRLLSMVSDEVLPPEYILSMFKEKGPMLKESYFRAVPELLSSKEVCRPKTISLESANAVEKTMSHETTKVESSKVEHEPLLEKEKIVTDEVQESGAKDKKEIVEEQSETTKLEGEKISDADYDSDDEVIREDVIKECMAEVSKSLKDALASSTGEIVTELIEKAKVILKSSAEEMQMAIDDLEDSFTNLNNCKSNTAQKAEVKSE